jgi:hypothetical protein
MSCATCNDSGLVMSVITDPNSSKSIWRLYGQSGPKVDFRICNCVRALLPTFCKCVECGNATESRVNPCTQCLFRKAHGPLTFRHAQAGYETAELLTKPHQVVTPEPASQPTSEIRLEVDTPLSFAHLPNAGTPKYAPGVTYAAEIPENKPDLSALERRWDDYDVVWRVVETDNLGRDYPDEKFHGPCLIKSDAEAVAAIFNKTAETTHRYYKVRPYTYKLQPGFEP